MKELLIGTHNIHKVKEISRLLSDLAIKIRSLVDFPDIVPAVEDGKTLEENAIKKAKSYGQTTGLFTLTDDTGLEVAVLNGEPGVKSARYAGERCSYEDNNRKLCLPERFSCARLQVEVERKCQRARLILFRRSA